MSGPGRFGHPAPRVLLTGSTGLLGTALLADLIGRGFHVLAVARGRGRLNARERFRRILSALEIRHDAAGRIEPIDTQLEGGLRASLSRLPPPDAVIHAAAAVKFNTPFADLLHQNVKGTEDLLEILHELAPGAEFHFVSTAYVGGRHQGVFLESDRSVGRTFHHDYEESKLLAERCVSKHCRRTARPFSVYRPSIIAGSSQDGRAANFNGIYSFLRPLDTLARIASHPTARSGTRVFFHCDPEATKNLVPVDWVASSIGALLEKGAQGKTYHLTHPHPVRHAELLDIVRRLPGLERLEVSASAESHAPTDRAQKLVERGLRGLAPYLWGEPSFDRRNLEAALGSAAEPPPVDLGYFSRLLEFGRRVRWHERPFEEARAMNDGGATGRSFPLPKVTASQGDPIDAISAHGVHSGPR